MCYLTGDQQRQEAGMGENGHSGSSAGTTISLMFNNRR
jgi:hypothetical protein